MSSTFLTRLRVGEILDRRQGRVAARGSRRVGLWPSSADWRRSCVAEPRRLRPTGRRSSASPRPLRHLIAARSCFGCAPGCGRGPGRAGNRQPRRRAQPLAFGPSRDSSSPATVVGAFLARAAPPGRLVARDASASSRTGAGLGRGRTLAGHRRSRADAAPAAGVESAPWSSPPRTRPALRLPPRQERLDVRVDLDADRRRTPRRRSRRRPLADRLPPDARPQGRRSPVRPVPDCGDPLGRSHAMFDLRYHVASLAAVFLALIIGIVVGVGISGKGFVSDSERRVLNERDRRPEQPARLRERSAEPSWRAPSAPRRRSSRTRIRADGAGGSPACTSRSSSSAGRRPRPIAGRAGSARRRRGSAAADARAEASRSTCRPCAGRSGSAPALAALATTRRIGELGRRLGRDLAASGGQRALAAAVGRTGRGARR